MRAFNYYYEKQKFLYECKCTTPIKPSHIITRDIYPFKEKPRKQIEVDKVY